MCGITGIFGSISKDIQYKTIHRMVSTLQHRGPDGWGTYVAPGIAFGHTRLSIVDIAGGKQPMMNDRYVIVYNGEVYNHPELREEMETSKSVFFSTNCDTEVVLKAYEIYGLAAFEKFNGQFAIAIWDRREHTLILARDRYGVRPLYIVELNGLVYFSSEMKAFDCIDGYNRTFNPENVFEHALLWNTLENRTVYNGITSLLPGTCKIYKSATNSVEYRYYEIGRGIVQTPASFDKSIEEFRSLLSDAVRIRLRSDVPVGTYLSGGIDSSVITSLTCAVKEDQLRTFSVAFSDKEFDESEYQNLFSNHIHSSHSAVQISCDSINDSFLDAAYHFERPVFRTAPVPLYLLSRLVAQNGFKVVLTGEGADEILCGYDTFKELRLLEAWKKDSNSIAIPEMISELYPHLSHYNDPAKLQMLMMFYEGFVDQFENVLAGLNIRASNNMAIARFYNKDHKLKFNRDKLVSSIEAILPANFREWTIIQRNQYLEIKTLLEGYLLSSQGDRMSMAHGVEGRYPFLDHRIVDMAFSFPDDFKLKGTSQKHILKMAFANAIPEPILKRPKRPYMSPDLRSFFRNGKPTEVCEYLLSDSMCRNCGLFDSEMVQRLIKKIVSHSLTDAGYRDNMILTFILSSHASYHWIKNKKDAKLPIELKKVEVSDY